MHKYGCKGISILLLCSGLLRFEKAKVEDDRFLALLRASVPSHADVSGLAETARRRKRVKLSETGLVLKVFHLFTGTVVLSGQLVDPKNRR